MEDVSTRCLAKLCSAGYNGSKALITPAAISSLASCGWTTSADAIYPLGEPDPAVDGGVEGFVIRAVSIADPEHATAIVVIRGTRSEAEWKASYSYKLTALPVPGDFEASRTFVKRLRPHCHEGFLQMWAPIASQLRDTLVALDCHTWLFCGNSRGGAMASIAAVDCGVRLLPDLNTANGRPADAYEAASHGLAVRDAAKAVTAAAVAVTAAAKAVTAEAKAVTAEAVATESAAAATTRATEAPSSPDTAPRTVPRVQCVTFASPRAGNSAFVQLFRRTMVLYARHNDRDAPTTPAAASSSSASPSALLARIREAVSTSHRRDALGRCERWAVGRDLVPTIPPAILGYRHVPACRYVADLSTGRIPSTTAAVSAAGAALGHVMRGPSDDHNIDRLVAWFDAEHAAGRAPWKSD
jgi:hypothetical protein